MAGKFVVTFGLANTTVQLRSAKSAPRRVMRMFSEGRRRCIQSNRVEVSLDAVGAAIPLIPSSRSVEPRGSRFAGRPAVTTSQPAPVTDGPRFHTHSEPSPTDYHLVFPGTLSHPRPGGLYLYPHTGGEIRPIAITGQPAPAARIRADSHQRRRIGTKTCRRALLSPTERPLTLWRGTD